MTLALSASASDSPDNDPLLGYPGDPALGPWHVLHTKSRQEKALADELAKLRLPHFLPIITQPRFYGRRKVHVDLPLFPGYLFLRGPVESAYAADRMGRVANIIKVTNQDQIDWELRNIYRALGQGAAQFDPFPALQKGVRVEVRSGPFRGLQGIIEDRTKRDRLILQVQTLGRAISLELDGSLLDVID